MNNDLKSAQAAVQAHREKHPELMAAWRKEVQANLTLTEQRILNMLKTHGTSYGWYLDDVPRDVKNNTLRDLRMKGLAEMKRIPHDKSWITIYVAVAS